MHSHRSHRKVPILHRNNNRTEDDQLSILRDNTEFLTKVIFIVGIENRFGQDKRKFAICKCNFNNFKQNFYRIFSVFRSACRYAKTQISIFYSIFHGKNNVQRENFWM